MSRKKTKKLKIAVYGGSFNPPHLGHFRVAQSAVEDIHPDKLLIIPDNLPPHKELSSNAPAAPLRLEMCKIAFRDIECAEVSSMELDRGGRSYTYDTLVQLHELYPGAEFVLIMGQDMMDSFSTWHRPDDILKLCTLYVAPRPDGSESSSAARKQIESDGYSPMLSAEINKFIQENNLYTEVKYDGNTV